MPDRGDDQAGRGDEGAEQIVDDLLPNALRATPAGTERARACERFSRNPADDRSEGSGLGLTIVAGGDIIFTNFRSGTDWTGSGSRCGWLVTPPASDGSHGSLLR
ncbi:hypothetical protein ACFVYA_31665 [Amycolatopsis sp. NPDC058278]|uniref:hypothetical protein n=1 Tax=Amycolatopsis sp. NPDC058278 TaxID=3346417 RepID=UPI0036DC58FC